jgi:hypothetical protein
MTMSKCEAHVTHTRTRTRTHTESQNSTTMQNPPQLTNKIFWGTVDDSPGPQTPRQGREGEGEGGRGRGKGKGKEWREG